MPLSSLAIFIIASACTITAVVLGILILALTRTGPTETNFDQDLREYEERMGDRRAPYTFVFDASTKSFTLKKLPRMYSSDSMETIQISSSHPTIFGNEKIEEKSMKVVLTPPTPAKKERGVLSSRMDVHEMEVADL
ncbi:hypothetical protein FA15DRAFT_209082 [Coprinopsis marcescibilis]|uniref:Uncharacterized protein n=1 Tax=Coprinopsis marcescibilis TaxID=230819 RepID=A0A5C3L3L2_COPMA|nr:hypothetical protein FA15DRAFT_209082 [Coprinopsis marcescibilis]